MQIKGSRYDMDLQMFVEPPREPDLAHLRFLRWLCEHGRLERGPAGASAGECARLASAGYQAAT